MQLRLFCAGCQFLDKHLDGCRDGGSYCRYTTEQTGDVYPPYNKPGSVKHWLENDPPDADYIIFIDADMLFLNTFTPQVELGDANTGMLTAAVAAAAPELHLAAVAGGGSCAIQTGRWLLRVLSRLGQAFCLGQVHPGRESAIRV